MDRLPGDADGRRSELEHAFLNVQRERVALTESFTRLGGECRSSSIDGLVVRLLRLQRAVEMAQDLTLANETATSNHMNYGRPAAFDESGAS